MDVLIPYQKGRCFYCNRPLNQFVDKEKDEFPDVDHFFPFSIIRKMFSFNPNGVWNLVIACRSCNRGSNGKFDSPPAKIYFDKLKKRNILFVEEHKHTLRNSILMSLEVSTKEQVSFKMEEVYKNLSFINGWKPKEIFSNEVRF